MYVCIYARIACYCLFKMADFLVQQLPLLFLLILGIVVLAAEHHPDLDECPITNCSDDGPLIQFPFRQKNYPLHCGHPDFEVFCLNNLTMIQLSSSSGIFPIRTVDFEEQNFEVYDQDGCLPRRFLNFTISSELFRLLPNYSDPCQFDSSYNTFTLLNCSTAQSFSTSTDGQKSYLPIKCLSVPGHHQVLAAPESTSMADLPVPTCSTSLTHVYFPLQSVDGSKYNCESDNRLFLGWYVNLFPACQNCHENCHFNYTSDQIECSPYLSDVSPSTKKRSNVSPYFQNPKGLGSKPRYIIIGVSIVCFALISALVIVYYAKQSNWMKEKENHIKIEKFLNDHKSHVPTRYSYADIKKMTNGFKEKLGQGGFGSVFSGKLSNNGVPVAVKVLKDSKGNGEDFVNEVGTIGRIHHVNVVRLLGFSAEEGKRALIYELMPNRSLEKFIKSRVSNNNSSSFDWEKLHHIIIGIAKGIEYLHQGCNQRILHFDIKPHNILLDHNLNPKISDFGLAKLCSKEQSAISMTAARGTIGYIAPELYGNFGTVSYKSDVYSFGMLVLETIGARKSDGTSSNSDVYFPEVIYNSLLQGDKLDLELHTDEDAQIAKRLVIVAIWCIQWYPFTRPSMKEVVRMLEGASESLVMPPNPFPSTTTQTPLSS